MIDNSDIILASGSIARKAMLKNIGLDFRIIPANIDEQAIIQKHKHLDIISITEKLAKDKALYISKDYPENIVIGSDQTLEFKGEIFSKSANFDEAKEKLKMLRGNTHKLYSSVCVANNEDIIFTHTGKAELTMHDFSDVFLQKYMDKNHDALTSCVGGYKIEGKGAWLFSSIKGDIFTIMGMPLLPLLGFLNND